jgi:hypothetical protein
MNFISKNFETGRFEGNTEFITRDENQILKDFARDFRCPKYSPDNYQIAS